ncbi:hypothetical protein [Enterococcus dongliensis]|nr:hypothetical protein [Enterococcus dongliensis]
MLGRKEPPESGGSFFDEIDLRKSKYLKIFFVELFVMMDKKLKTIWI